MEQNILKTVLQKQLTNLNRYMEDLKQQITTTEIDIEKTINELNEIENSLVANKVGAKEMDRRNREQYQSVDLIEIIKSGEIPQFTPPHIIAQRGIEGFKNDGGMAELINQQIRRQQQSVPGKGSLTANQPIDLDVYEQLERIPTIYMIQ